MIQDANPKVIHSSGWIFMFSACYPLVLDCDLKSMNPSTLVLDCDLKPTNCDLKSTNTLALGLDCDLKSMSLSIPVLDCDLK